MKSSKSLIYWISGGSVLLLSIIIFFVFFWRKDFIRETGRFPYIYNYETNKTVNRYLETEVSNQILFVVGGKKSGKTRLLEVISEHLIQKRRLPIFIRFDAARTIEDFAESLKFQLIRTLNLISNYFTDFDFQIAQSLEIQSDSKDYTPKFNRAGPARMYRILEDSIDKSLETLDPNYLFDTVALFTPIFRPCILISSYELLKSLPNRNGTLVGETLYNNTIKRIFRSDQYVNYVPIITEIHDSSLLLNITEPYFTTFTDLIEDPVINMYETRKLFTQSEIQVFSREIGTHGGSLAIAFENLKYGIPCDVSAQTIKQEIIDDLQKIKLTFKTPVWPKLCQNKNPATAWSAKYVRELLPLIQKGYLWIGKDREIKPSNGIVSNYICQKIKGMSFIKDKHDLEMEERNTADEVIFEAPVKTTEPAPDTKVFVNKTKVNVTTINQTKINNSTQTINETVVINDIANATVLISSTNTTVNSTIELNNSNSTDINATTNTTQTPVNNTKSQK